MRHHTLISPWSNKKSKTLSCYTRALFFNAQKLHCDDGSALGARTGQLWAVGWEGNRTRAPYRGSRAQVHFVKKGQQRLTRLAWIDRSATRTTALCVRDEQKSISAYATRQPLTTSDSTFVFQKNRKTGATDHIEFSLGYINNNDQTTSFKILVIADDTLLYTHPWNKPSFSFELNVNVCWFTAWLLELHH